MAASSQDEIAIVGMGCRVPGAENLDEYWRVLLCGENHVREVTDDRLVIYFRMYQVMWKGGLMHLPKCMDRQTLLFVNVQ